MNPTVSSMFSGCGGFDLGFMWAGFEVIWANDFDLDACETYRRNIGKHIIEADIRTVDLSSIPQADVLIGGFPCQDFSAVGKRRGLGGDRGDYYEFMVEAIRLSNPQAFIAENVPALLTANDGKAGKVIVGAFSDLGYEVTTAVVNFADYGVPQNRRRVLIIGTPSHYILPFPTTPIPLSAGQALRGVELVADNNEAAPPTPREREILPYIRAGENAKQAMKRKPDLLSWNPFGNVFRRIHPDRPAPTICAGLSSGGGWAHYHHTHDRKLTNREAARLSGFPDDFIFEGKARSVRGQIGNSVPPTGILPIANSIFSVLFDTQDIFAHWRQNET